MFYHLCIQYVFIVNNHNHIFHNLIELKERKQTFEMYSNELTLMPSTDNKMSPRYKVSEAGHSLYVSSTSTPVSDVLIP